jgi:hypothetical protein
MKRNHAFGSHCLFKNHMGPRKNLIVKEQIQTVKLLPLGGSVGRRRFASEYILLVITKLHVYIHVYMQQINVCWNTEITSFFSVYLKHEGQISGLQQINQPFPDASSMECDWALSFGYCVISLYGQKQRTVIIYFVPWVFFSVYFLGFF